MPSLSDIIPAPHSCVAHPYTTGHRGSIAWAAKFDVDGCRRQAPGHASSGGERFPAIQLHKFEQGNVSLTI